ncbi:methyltransferase domain-containing protein [Halotia wernerae UHCC 0503]|nr:methyltransferase domain-containing protein [Halotia wernerae UHCC 0503]
MNTNFLNQMVGELKEQGAIKSIEVEKAFSKVLRHKFLETFYLPGDLQQPINHKPNNPASEHLRLIYSKNSLITRISDGKASSSTSEPMLIAYMLELLALSPNLKVLEIGTGTGYNAALISEIVGDQTLVVSVDIQEDVIAQTKRLLSDAGYPKINLVFRDGFYGVQEEATYDRIVATVGTQDISPYWAAQLSNSGFMILPLYHGGWTPLVRVWWQDGTLKGKVVGISGFMPFKGNEFAYDPSPLGSMTSFPAIEEFEELPLFDDLEAEHTRNPLMWSAFPMGFQYFIAICDPRAMWGMKPPGYGLYDKQEGIILVSPRKNCILLKGDRKLYKRLQELYENWSHLDKPSPFDYTIEFLPKSKATPSSRQGWSIERKFYHQFLSL